jgi:hypothetical protein
MDHLNPALRQELLEMAARDQAMRQEMSGKYRPGDRLDPAEAAAALAVDRDNTARMKEIIAEHGWPGVTLVGDDGANAAWLITQHADLDVPFQQQCLPLLAASVAAGEARPDNLAYLTDRVRVHTGQPQVYGTQLTIVGGELVPSPIEDEAHVDERRARVGLDSLADYVALARELYSLQGTLGHE